MKLNKVQRAVIATLYIRRSAMTRDELMTVGRGFVSLRTMRALKTEGMVDARDRAGTESETYEGQRVEYSLTQSGKNFATSLIEAGS